MTARASLPGYPQMMQDCHAWDLWLLSRRVFAKTWGGATAACGLQGPVGVSNKHVETAIDEASGKLTMLYQVNIAYTVMPCSTSSIRKIAQD